VRLILKKTNGGDLVPWQKIDHEYIRKLKDGEKIICQVKRARNAGHHRLFFALLNASISFGVRLETDGGVFEFRDVEILRKYLLHRYGWTEMVPGAGEQVKSMDFDTMGQDEFKEFYDFAIKELANLCECEEVHLEADEIIARTA